MKQVRYVGNGWLDVLFHSGHLYRYYDVPVEVFEAFVNASSKGKFVWRELRGKYQYARL